MSGRHRILLLLEFDGTDFRGFQTQQGVRTVQQDVEDAIEKLTGARLRLYGSSRTDAGVHAAGLPATFVTDKALPEHAWVRGLNALLGPDLCVRKAACVPESFHVRRSARGKIYRYSIWNGPTRRALLQRRFWHVKWPLDPVLMQRAAQSLVGEHDFTSFRAAGCQARSRIRRVVRVDVEGERGGELTITVEGNAFLQHMVRICVGTLVDVGRGHRPEDFPALALEALDRASAGPTAPPHGLTLEQVIYEPSPFGAPDDPV